ncbi:MAG TPA: CoA-binding protein, partial [Verrucomicrobiae bacterium]|nr:CoA-binding protein [Verrucomicrobiae bacterium]
MADATTHFTDSKRLQRLLSPKSIAVIGASNKMPSIGGYVMANIARLFDGALYPVNPREAEVQGHPAFASVEALPRDIDLAMIVVPAESVPATLEGCAAHGIAGVVIITSGFAEIGGAGIPLQEKIAEIIKRTGIRATGPNCIGFMNIADRVMANFVVDPKDELPKGGPVARMPVRLMISAIFSCRGMPAPPISAKPDVMITT